MDPFPHHIRPVLRGGDYYLARYFCEGLAVEVRGEVFCFQREEDADKFRGRFGCVTAELEKRPFVMGVTAENREDGIL